MAQHGFMGARVDTDTRVHEKYSALRYHFGDTLPTQKRALLAWAEFILFKSGDPMRPLELVEYLRSGLCVPYPISIEPQEAEDLVQLGVRSGYLFSDDGETYRLSLERRAALRNAEIDAALAEKAARLEWHDQVVADYPSITEELFEDLWEGLWDYTANSVRRYVRFLDGTNGDYVFVPFAKDHVLYRIAEVEYPKFLTSGSQASRLVINRQLSHVLYVYRTTVSEAVHNLVRGTLVGRVIYLDTNVLLPALGLTGDASYEEGVRAILRLARRVGMKLMYTERTATEYSAAFDSFRRRFVDRGNPDIDPEYMVRRQRPSIDRAFYAERYKVYRSVEEFYERHSNLDGKASELAAVGIEKDTAITRADYERIASSQFMTDVEEAIKREERRNLEERVVEHDAHHIALVRDRRFSGSRDLANAWFMSLDNSLIRVDRRLQSGIPLVLTPDRWVLLFRQFLPRVENFEEFFGQVATRSLFPSFYLNPDDIVRFERITEVGGDDRASEVVSRILRTTPSQEIETVFSGAADDVSIVEGLHQLAEHMERMERQVAELGLRELSAKLEVERTEKRGLGEELRTVAGEKESAIRALDGLLQQLDKWGRQRDVLQRELSDVQQDLDALEASEKRAALWWIIGLALLLGAIALAGYLFIEAVHNNVAIFAILFPVFSLGLLPASQEISRARHANRKSNLLGRRNSLQRQLEKVEHELQEISERREAL